jgi:hypothetical protein
VYRLRSVFSLRLKDTMTHRSYTRGPNLWLAVLQVRQACPFSSALLTNVGMVSQFAVYPIDTLKL